MSTDEPIAIRHGTDNVFADLGYADADTHLLKAELVARVQDVISERKLTQVAVARIVGMSQPDISRMLKGQYRDISVERIMRVLTKLGCEVDIVIKPRGRAQAYAAIHLSPAPAE